MNYYGLEVTIEGRRNKTEFNETDKLITSMVADKFKNGEKIKCAICGNELDSNYRIAYRVFKDGTKKVIAHPVHKNCLKEEDNMFTITSNYDKYSDLSKTDYLNTLKLLDVLKSLDK